MSQKQKQSDEEITRKAILAGDGGILPDGRTVRQARAEFLSLESQKSQESLESLEKGKEKEKKEEN
jgi:hypothetical protein